LRRGCGSRGTRLLRRWSGVTGGEGCGEDGARVGDDVVLDGGSTAGSKSRSGIGGETNGCCVIFNSKRRRETLETQN